MRRWARLLPLLAAAACSGLDEGEGGVVALEIQIPELLTLEVGEQAQLSARALDVDGETVNAPITWRASNDALTVDATGLVTGVEQGSGDVQAAVGSLTSEGISFSILTPADTVIIVGDSVFVIPIVADPPGTANLVVRLESRSPVGPVGSRPVIYEITQPVAGVTPVVQLTGGVQSDTVLTATDGTAPIALDLVTGQTPPDTAIVEVRANRIRGSTVPGSGQRFIILFQ
ncbi:MAG: Ig-like domain-containing protein [Actinomycetota bacterium]|nr:Ig-like domain-containing protein [Actinomycetota bacterium]